MTQYDPTTADADWAGSIPGNLGSECYGLYGLPFVECANYKAILEKNDLITSIYTQFIVPRSTTAENAENLETVQSLVRSIYGYLLEICDLSIPWVNSVFAHTAFDPYWLTNVGEIVDVNDDRYNDYSIDRTGWRFVGPPAALEDSLILSDIRTGLSFARAAALSIANAELIEVDLTGERYAGQSCNSGGPTIILSSGGNQGTVEQAFYVGVAYYGPDAANRYINNIPSREGDRTTYPPDFQRYYNEDYTFFNMCLNWPQCIKPYREKHPIAYSYDLGNLTNDQLEILNPFQAGQVMVDELSRAFSSTNLETAKQNLTDALTKVTNSEYYSVEQGLLNPEALRKVAIVILILLNSIELVKESLTGISLSEELLIIQEERRILLEEQLNEYNRLKAIEEEFNRLLAETQAEKLIMCNPIIDPLIPNPCRNRNNSGFKTFLDDWRKKNKNEPYHDIDKKKYYLSYDVVEEQLNQVRIKADSYKLEVYNILNEKFSLQLPENPSDVGIDPVTFVTMEDIYIEPRRFMPSRILYCLDESEVNLITQIAASPRTTDVGIIQEGQYIRVQIFTIEQFYRYLQVFENVLRKYTFDHALWKITFGESFQRLDPTVLSTTIFEQLKTDKIKQDLKIFRLVRPLFTKLMSKNSVEVLEDLSFKKDGQYGVEDKITLVFSFTPADPTKPLETVDGSNIIRGAQQVLNQQPAPENNLPTMNNSGLETRIITSNDIKLLRVQLSTTSRPPTNLIWKAGPGQGDLSGLEAEEPFKNSTILNYLMNLDTIIQFLRPEET
jgi:hypothetical protein